MQIRSVPIHFLAATALLMSPAPALSQQFAEIGHSVDSVEAPAAGRFATTDVDADGLPDLVFTGNGGGTILLVFGLRADGEIGLKQADPIPGTLNVVRTLAWSPSGVPHIILVDNVGIAHDLAGWPLVEQRSFAVQADAKAAAIGDVDADGTDDLVVATSAGVHIYSLASGSLLRTFPAPGVWDVALGQFDADPALEMVLGGTAPGLVLDGATGATDWASAVGFGMRVATGRLGAGGSMRWITPLTWGTFTVFQGAPWGPDWSGVTPQDISAVATATIDNSGLDVALVGDGQFGKLRVFDSSSHLQRFEISHAGSGIQAIGSGDLDGDGITDIAFTPFSTSPGLPIFTLVDSQTAKPSWQFVPTNGPLTVTALGDVDGDGHVELVAASSPYGTNGSIAIFDFATGVVEWRSPPGYIGNANDPYYILPRRIRLVPHAGMPGMSIVVAGTSIYDGRIIVMDGVTKDVTLQIGFFNTGPGPMASRSIASIEMHDWDSDGTEDFVAVTQPTTTGAQGILVQVFSGADGSTLWTSPAMGTGFGQANDVLLVDEGASGAYVIAVLPESLRAFDVATGAPTWVLAASNQGARVIDHGVSGREIAVFTAAGGVTFYSADDRSYLRSFAVPAPITALVALDHDVRKLLVQTGDSLTVVDGESGTIRGVSSGYLGIFGSPSAPPAFLKTGNDTWNVVCGSHDALFRLRLDFPDLIFADSFDGIGDRVPAATQKRP